MLKFLSNYETTLFPRTALSSWSQSATVSELEVKLNDNDVTYVDSTPCTGSDCASQTITFTVILDEASARTLETYSTISVMAGDTEVASVDTGVTEGTVTGTAAAGSTFSVDDPAAEVVTATLVMVLPVPFDLGDQDWVGRVTLDSTPPTDPVDSSPKHLDKYS